MRHVFDLVETRISMRDTMASLATVKDVEERRDLAHLYGQLMTSHNDIVEQLSKVEPSDDPASDHAIIEACPALKRQIATTTAAGGADAAMPEQSEDVLTKSPQIAEMSRTFVDPVLADLSENEAAMTALSRKDPSLAERVQSAAAEDGGKPSFDDLSIREKATYLADIATDAAFKESKLSRVLNAILPASVREGIREGVENAAANQLSGLEDRISVVTSRSAPKIGAKI